MDNAVQIYKYFVQKAEQQNQIAMEVAPIPPNEQRRLDALNSYRILDTEIEWEFDEITKITSELFGSPISIISLIDSDRQWYKSALGTDIKEVKREISICAYTINSPDQVLVIENLLDDQRFSDNPMISEKFGARFYAGAPIVDKNGMAIGTLCILDNKPRKLNSNQIERLKGLAEMVMRQIENRLVNKHLRQYLEMQTGELKAAVSHLKKEIAERKLEENRLEDKLNEQRQISELRAHLVHSISHQIKTPLTAISTSTQLLEMLIDSKDSRQKKHIARILGSVQSMADMVENMHYLHQIDFVNPQESASRIHMGKLIYDTIDQIKVEYGSSDDIEIQVLEESNYEFPSNILFIERLLRILASNAIKYNAPGSKIHIQYSVNDKTFQFNINNRGLPLDKEEVGQIFNLFYRGNNKEDKEGLGVGLTIAKKIIDTLKGKIRVESSRDKGTTFFVLIPAITIKENQHAA